MNKRKLESILVRSNIDIEKTMRKLNETAEKILFVVDKREKLLGVITDGDIRRSLINGCELREKIKNIMHKNFLSVSSNVLKKEEYAKKLMLEKKVDHIPILDEEGTITDIVSLTDIIENKSGLKGKHFYSNQVIIMAGGKGTHLDPFTRVLPKPLIPIGTKPIIELIMERFYQSGFSRFTYSLNYKKGYLKLFLRENDFPYIIDWIEEEKFMGTAGSLSLLKGKISETFFVVNCDSLLRVNFQDILKWHKNNGATITIIGCNSKIKIPFGVLMFSNGIFKKILEKPDHDFIANTGVYIMEPHVISYLSCGKKIDMNELIKMVSEKEKVAVYPISGDWFDIGQWERYRNTINELNGTERE